jgi:alpha/beta superfamily hydrolase
MLWRWIGVALVVLASLPFIFSFVVALLIIRPKRRAFDQHPRAFAVPHEDVRFPGPAGLLNGWYLPGTNGCTLIALHGIADNRQQWLAPAMALQERGYSCLLLDFRRHGESQGRFATMGDQEVGDVAATLEFLRQRGDVDMTRVGVMGLSLGGITAILAGARLPAIRAVMAEAAFGDLAGDLALAFTHYTGMPAFPLANLTVFWGRVLTGTKLSRLRPVELIGQIAPRPVFIIGDLKDELVDEPRTSQDLYAHAGEPKQLWQVPAGHVRAYAADPVAYIERLDAFFHQALS